MVNVIILIKLQVIQDLLSPLYEIQLLNFPSPRVNLHIAGHAFLLAAILPDHVLVDELGENPIGHIMDQPSMQSPKVAQVSVELGHLFINLQVQLLSRFSVVIAEEFFL